MWWFARFAGQPPHYGKFLCRNFLNSIELEASLIWDWLVGFYENINVPTLEILILRSMTNEGLVRIFPHVGALQCSAST